MRFDLASPASIFFFFLVPFLAPMIIAQQHQPNVDVTHLDPRASFLGPMSLVKNGAPPGYLRGDHSGEGAGGKDLSLLEVKVEHHGRGSGPNKFIPSIEALHRGHATVSSRKATSLSPEAIAFCAQEAQAITAADFAAVKSRRFLSDDKETVAMAALYEKRWNCCDNCGCYDCVCCAKERSVEEEEGSTNVILVEETPRASPLLTREAVAAAHAAAVQSGRFESFKQIISQLGVEERNENCWELCGCGACECC